MAFVFPEDKADFLAPNGVTYSWDGEKWVVRAFQGSDGSSVYIGEDPPDEPAEEISGSVRLETRSRCLSTTKISGFRLRRQQRLKVSLLLPCWNRIKSKRTLTSLKLRSLSLRSLKAACLVQGQANVCWLCFPQWRFDY